MKTHRWTAVFLAGPIIALVFAGMVSANHGPSATCLNRGYDRIVAIDAGGIWTGTAQKECVYENFSTGQENTWDLKAGNDGAMAGPGSDWVEGGDGNDWIWGEWGPDFLFGDRHNDRLYEGNGSSNDHIIGGPGDDIVYCGHGADLCHDLDSGNDTIYHCHDGEADDIAGFTNHIDICG